METSDHQPAEPVVYPHLGLTDLRDATGANVRTVAETGTPVILDDRGVPTGVMLAPVSLLRPDALPPAYFSEEARRRAARFVAEYVSAEYGPQAFRAATDWAESLPGIADDPAA
jgi:hypothetical protein